jgi:hypothetical protein
MEDEHVVRLADEDPVEHERVEVDVEIELPAEPLDTRHHARFAAGEPHPFAWRRYAERSARTKTPSTVRHRR